MLELKLLSTDQLLLLARKIDNWRAIKDSDSNEDQPNQRYQSNKGGFTLTLSFSSRPDAYSINATMNDVLVGSEDSRKDPRIESIFREIKGKHELRLKEEVQEICRVYGI